MGVLFATFSFDTVYWNKTYQESFISLFFVKNFVSTEKKRSYLTMEGPSFIILKFYSSKKQKQLHVKISLT